MNSKQKEVLQSELNNEKKVIKELEQVYTQAIKDCEQKIRELSMRSDMENLQSIVYQKQYQQAIKGQLEGVLSQLHSNEFSTVSEYLNKCYTTGFAGSMYDLTGQGIPLIVPISHEQILKAIQTDSKLSKTLYDSLGEDVSKLKTAVRAQVSRGISNGSSWNDIAKTLAERNMKNTPFGTAINNATRIVRTEGHRVQTSAKMDAMKEAKKKGADVVKQWDSTLDGNTRTNHRLLDGQIREIDEPFEVGGMEVDAPGYFGDPAEDCNCRCAVLQRAKWALDDSELETLQQRAEYFGLDKTEDFEDYKQKYLKLPQNADTIELKDKPSENTVVIGGLKCCVEEVKSQDFPDGSESGVKKTVPAVVYTTPDGTRFIYQKQYDKAKQSLTPEQAIEVWAKIPDNIRNKIQKEVYVVDYYNPKDSYWRKRYKNFGHSYATGGEDITLYRSSYHDMEYLLHTYCHEGGHYIDYTTKGADKTNRYCKQQKWKDAMSKDFKTSGKKSYREYGENSELEDFADSVGYYVTKHDEFAKLFPERTKLLDEILK